MKKLLNALPLLFAITAISALAGCELYFGDHGHDDSSWSYCGSDGYYQCNGDNCQLVSTTCPDGSGGGGGSNGSGYECGSNGDCSAGCYCNASGVCEEGGFCGSDSDCGSGYHCDTSRSSCEPNGPTQTCGSDSDCTGTDQICDTTTGTCQQASCGGTVTCNSAIPVCPSGSVPLIYNGCYTGTCGTYATCDVPPTCSDINDEADCLSRTGDCTAVYSGQDCTDANGNACVSGDTGCTCASFTFDHCSAKGAQ